MTISIKVIFSDGWKKSKIYKGTLKEGYYNDCSISKIVNIPKQTKVKDVIEKWDKTNIATLMARHTYDWAEIGKGVEINK